VAKDCEAFGAEGITVHPRPDERHIRYKDVYDLKQNISTEFNIEGNPKEDKFVELVLANQPAQVTLVPDALNQLTSDHGWDTIKEQAYLKEIISKFKNAGIRVSIFVDPNEAMVEAAATTGTDRIELYTESYAKAFEAGKKEEIIQAYIKAAEKAKQLGLGINAGHDLDRHNLPYLIQQIPFIDEVSIGHALISDALYLGLENTIQLYKRALSPLK
jgi:pyridoxine 5-phosphate synthase